MEKLTITKKDGTIYSSCPFIDEILNLCDKQQKTIENIKIQLEAVRQINSKLRENQVSDDYIKDKIKEAKDEVWEEVGDIIGTSRRWAESELKNLVKRVNELEDENKNLLQKLDDLEFDNKN